MSENTDKPLTVEPGQPVTLRNCWTCGWDVKNADCRHICTAASSDKISDWSDQQYWSPRCMPTDDADGCPGWKPKDEPGATLDNCGVCYSCKSPEERVTTWTSCPTCGNKRCPKATHHDHACTGSNEPGQPGSRYGDWKPKDEIERRTRERIEQHFGGLRSEKIADTITVQRAAWDALLSRIAALESRVDDAERVARKAGPRFEALRRRDRLRGGR